MKRNILTIIFLMVFTNTICLSQTQMKNWYIAPSKIDMSGLIPAVSAISSTAATATKIANGFYDSSGNLLFYYADGTLYDYNSTVIGSIPSGGAEVAIVPFGTNYACQKKFNIFTTSGGVIKPVALWKTVLDMSNYSLELPSTEIDGFSFGNEFGAIAVGKEFGVNKDRYLYFMAGSGFPGPSGQINKLIIHNDGSVSSSIPLYPTATVTNPEAGIDVFSKELEISPDGRWLAWASFTQGSIGGPATPLCRYHFVALNGTGDLDIATYGTTNVYQEFNVPGTYNYSNSGFRGIEFYKDATGLKLFMGAGNDGIYFTDVKIPMTLPISALNNVVGSSGTTTTSFGYSQIELANNGLMYASSLNIGLGFNIGAFNPNISFPSISGFNSINLPNPPNDAYTLTIPYTNFFTLPDQIDGQDYASIVSAPVPSILTANYTFNSAVPTVWTYGPSTVTNNPWGTSSFVHINNELIIEGNSNLTIRGMTFKFGANAKVIIKPGSTLTLDDLSGTPTVFTSDYDFDICRIPYTWEGVQVWGNKSLSQNTLPLVQGKLVIKNNSTIQFAKCGAKMYNPITQSLSSGGIIKVSSGGGFINCNVGVDFKPYQNFTGSINSGNKSTFFNAKFINNVNYPFSTGTKHVIIDRCTGIVFSNCTFANSIFQNMISIGIKSIDANFVVSNNTTFNNLSTGIDVSKASTINTFSVFNSKFIDNQIGIKVNNINNFVMQQNVFEIGGNLNSGATTQIGISNIACSGFIIEENDFKLSSSSIPSVAKWGISTNSCGSAPNQIYKNKFSDLNIGNYSVGINRDNNIPSINGLQYICNQNLSNDNFDFLISNKGGGNVGIRLAQGSNFSPAANQFTNLGPVGAFTDFNNTTSQIVKYYYSLGNAPIYFSGVNT